MTDKKDSPQAATTVVENPGHKDCYCGGWTDNTGDYHNAGCPEIAATTVQAELLPIGALAWALIAATGNIIIWSRNRSTVEGYLSRYPDATLTPIIGASPAPTATSTSGERYFTLVLKVPRDWKPSDEIMRHPHFSAASWSHALDDRDKARAALAQPAAPVVDGELPPLPPVPYGMFETADIHRFATDYALSTLAAARSASVGPWISVDDKKKPKPGEQILLFVRTLHRGEDECGSCREQEGEEIAMGEYRLTDLTDEQPYRFDCYTSPMSDSDWITHWMPLPAAPSHPEPTGGKERA